MKVKYTILNVENVGLDKVYTVKLRIVDSGDETQIMVNVPPGVDIKDVLKDIILADEEVIFVESS